MTPTDDTLPPLPEPEALHQPQDSPCPACETMLRYMPPIKLGYTADQMRAYAAQAVAAERERCIMLCQAAVPQPARKWSDVEITHILSDVIAAIRANCSAGAQSAGTGDNPR